MRWRCVPSGDVHVAIAPLCNWLALGRHKLWACKFDEELTIGRASVITLKDNWCPLRSTLCIGINQDNKRNVLAMGMSDLMRFFHQVLRSPRGLPLCGACMERKRHCRAGWTMRASKLRGSACTICTCDFFRELRFVCWRNRWVVQDSPISQCRTDHSAPSVQVSGCHPQCSSQRDFLFPVNKWLLSLNERICSLRYWSLPAYPSGPTKRDPTFRVARLKVNWGGSLPGWQYGCVKMRLCQRQLRRGDIKPWTSEDGQTCVTMYCHP